MGTPANEIQPGQFIEDDNGEVHQVTDIEETVTDNELTNGKLIIHAGDLCLIVEPDHELVLQQLVLPGMPPPPTIDQAKIVRRARRAPADTTSSSKVAS